MYKRDDSKNSIYFVENMGYVKIGLCKGDNPRRRLVEMKTNCPTEPKLLGWITFTASSETTRLIERQFHDNFKAYHFRGEWFFGVPVRLWLYDFFYHEGIWRPDALETIEGWGMYIERLTPGAYNEIVKRRNNA